MRNYDSWRNGIIKISGIYAITNVKNGKIYIGQSVDCGNRWSRHMSNHLNKNDAHYNQPLYQDMREQNLRFFKFSILKLCANEELDIYEQAFIEEAQKAGNDLYNVVGKKK